jgi:hypothetical protein
MMIIVNLTMFIILIVKNFQILDKQSENVWMKYEPFIFKHGTSLQLRISSQ